MAVVQRVLLVGGTGETGKEILKALLEAGNFVHTSSLTCPTTVRLQYM